MARHLCHAAAFAAMFAFAFLSQGCVASATPTSAAASIPGKAAAAAASIPGKAAAAAAAASIPGKAAAAATTSAATAIETSTTMTTINSASAIAAPFNRKLLGIPPCTAEYLPGCPEPTRTVFGNIVNGGGATVFLTGMPLRGTALPGSYNLSTVASANGDYAFSRIYRGTYDIMPKQAGFTFVPSSVKVEIAGADAAAPSMTRNP